MKVAFIGLGVMGYPMAGHVKKSGTDVCVYNRTAAKAEQWCKEYGGEMASTPTEAAEGCDIVLVCVGNDNDVRQVVAGQNHRRLANYNNLLHPHNCLETLHP